MGLSVKGVTSSVSKAVSKATKPISKAISRAAKPVSTAIRTAGKGTEQLVSSAARGDIKGIAKAGLNVVEGAKDVAQQSAGANLGFATGLASAVGSATGIKPVSQLASNVEREGQKGIEQYGDVALDVGANVATSGAYGAGKAALSGVSEGGIGSLVSPEMITRYGVDAAAAYAGVDPSMLKTGLAAAQGDIKGAALQGLGSYAGGQAASQLGIDPDTLNKAVDIGKSSLTGDLKKQALAQLGSSTGVPSDILNQVSTGKFDVNELARNANLTASIGGMASAYTPGSADKIKEQIQLGTAIASGDTQGLTDMATRRIVESADPYVQDEANAMLDQMGVAGVGRDKVRALQDIQAKTSDTYKIAKGDNLSKIAKKYGMTVEQFLQANPQLKGNANKIIAGAKLNIPVINQATQAISGARKNITDKYLKDAEGNTIYGANNAPILNPDYNSQAADELQMQRAGEANEPGFFDKVTSGAKDIAGKVTGFVAGNRDLINTGVQAGAAYMGYKAGEKGYEEAKKLAEQQLRETQGAGKQFAGMSFDPNRYKQEREFLQQRIAGQGYTAEEKKMQQEGDIRAARAAAAQRLSGLETQARLGGTAMGTSALAAALSGAQGSQNIQSETNLAREASAQQKMEQALQRQGGLSTQKTQEEANLAQSQGIFDLSRLQQVGASRGELGNIALGRAGALQNLYGRGADLAAGALGRMQAPEPQQQPQQSQTQAPQQDLNVRAGAANIVANRQPVRKPQPPTITKEKDKFNVANIPQYVARPQTAVEDAKKLAQQKLEQEKKKLINQGKEKLKEVVPGPLQGLLNKF